ncbi:MAG: T9SS type A sorting domain-containing protein, partial [Sphingobacteriales bacterium]
RRIQRHLVGDANAVRVARLVALGAKLLVHLRTETMHQNNLDAHVSVTGYYGPPGGPPSQTDSGIRTYVVRDSVLWDTLRMPEEWKHEMIYYYFPDDSSYCVVSPKYTVHNSMIWNDGRLNNFEPSTNTFSFKNQLGLISSGEYQFPNRMSYESLVSAGTPPSFCNEANGPVGITEARAGYDLVCRIFPNPSTGQVNIDRDNDIPFSVRVTDVVGRRALQALDQRRTFSFDVSGWAAGIYFISISAKNATMVRKMIVQH